MLTPMLEPQLFGLTTTGKFKFEFLNKESSYKGNLQKIQRGVEILFATKISLVICLSIANRLPVYPVPVYLILFKSNKA